MDGDAEEHSILVRCVLLSSSVLGELEKENYINI
jgi:hypothetical protein